MPRANAPDSDRRPYACPPPESWMHLRPPEMPSFVPDESSAIDSQSSGVVHLDRAAEYGFPQEKVNGHVRQPHSHTSNESFDESSTNSTKSSNTSESSAEAEQRVAKDFPHAPSMSSLRNGSVGGGSNHVGTVDSGPRKRLLFGNSMVVVDRTLPAQVIRTKTGDSPAQNPSHGATSTNGAEDLLLQNPGVEVYLHPVSKGDVRTVENGAASPTLPTANGPALAVEGLGAESNQRNQKGPHRFSSPPVYEPNPSSSGSLQPAPAPGIKHRHTLEVPKITSPRGSRDGIDAAYSSGRFSPTIAASGGRRASLSLARRNTRSLHSEVPRDEVVPDEDAMRWAEAYRQKRATKKRRREIEDDDRVLVGTKVDETHANWVTAYNMLTGIRVSVSRTNAKLDRALTDADFDVKQKSTFDM